MLLPRRSFSITAPLLLGATFILGQAGQAWAQNDVRFATFNASLNRNAAGQLMSDLNTPGNAQAKVIAETIQRVNPDILLINEFDYDSGGVSAQRFQDNYLSVSQHGVSTISFPYRYFAPSNTGIPSGFDFNNNGSIGGADDAYGFGNYPGQYGMMVYSKYPIDTGNVRTFQNFLWKDMPGAMLPDDPGTGAPADWYSPAELDVFRLSSKSHWDVPVNINGETVHVLVSHPTPPAFDGAEDRNGTRNHDEVRLWADYITPGAGSYIYDDNGLYGGLGANQKFVIMGDQNSDPLDGDSVPNTPQQLLNNPHVNTSITPTSAGGPDATARQGGINNSHLSNPLYDTADFADGAPGNLRADYVLPSANMSLNSAGVFWTTNEDPLFYLVGDFPFPGSDHRMVWADVAIPDGDFDDDGDVDANDVDLLWHIVRGTGTDPNNNDTADLDGNFLVNEDDVDLMLAQKLDPDVGAAGSRFGDADLDDDVDGNDFDAWRTRPGYTGAGTGHWSIGDFDGDGDVDGADFDLWRTRPATFPGTVGSHGDVVAVPEPATISLMASALIAGVLVRTVSVRRQRVTVS